MPFFLAMPWSAPGKKLRAGSAGAQTGLQAIGPLRYQTKSPAAALRHRAEEFASFQAKSLGDVRQQP
jgi:hypothetical protein